MALSVQAPLYSKPGTWGMGDLNTVFSSSPDSTPVMAYQYSMGSSGLDLSSNMIPSYHHLPGEHTQPSSPADAKPTSPRSKNRGNPTGLKSAKIKRSISTPNVRGQASADAAALALSAEKRRNKLGYHRTSVACGHCRRRKIRCIPAPGDTQGRCSNCIRLKKECNFFPVDQQPAPEAGRKGSKSQSGTGRASESSSPSTSSGQLPDLPPTLPYPHLSMPPIQDLGGPQMKKPRTESFSPENKVVTSSRGFDYNHGTNWMATDASPNTSSKTQPELPPSYWRVNSQESPMTPAFSPFTPNLSVPPPQNWPTSQTEASPREDLSWSVPQRSISYGNLEGLHGQSQYSPYPHPHPQAPPHSDHYSSKPRTLISGMHPPPISTTSSILPPPEASAAPHEGLPHPHSAGPHYPNWQQSYSYQKTTNESYGTWNSSHGAPPHILEEAHPPSTGYTYGQPYYPPPPPAR